MTRVSGYHAVHDNHRQVDLKGTSRALAVFHCKSGPRSSGSREISRPTVHHDASNLRLLRSSTPWGPFLLGPQLKLPCSEARELESSRVRTVEPHTEHTFKFNCCAEGRRKQVFMGTCRSTTIVVFWAGRTDESEFLVWAKRTRFSLVSTSRLY